MLFTHIIVCIYGNIGSSTALTTENVKYDLNSRRVRLFLNVTLYFLGVCRNVRIR